MGNPQPPADVAPAQDGLDRLELAVLEVVEAEALGEDLDVLGAARALALEIASETAPVDLESTPSPSVGA